MALHEIPLERRTLHGHFSRDLEPVLTIDSGDTIAFACPNAGWYLPSGERFEPRDPELDGGHALIGPVEVRGAKAGGVFEVRIDRIDVGTFGVTTAGGWHTDFNDRLGVGDLEERMLEWTIDAAAGTARDQHGREVSLRPFLGVMGMPPPDEGTHPTHPPRRWGGNIDCQELVAGVTLYLPISVAGALFSAGDGHGRQGDGEVSAARHRVRHRTRRAHADCARRHGADRHQSRGSETAWITLGFDEDLDQAAAVATDAMLELMGREHGLERTDALALASLVVDLV